MSTQHNAPKQRIQAMSHQFRPKAEYLLIKPAELETEKVSNGGIVIPVDTKSPLNRPSFGLVIAVGDDIDDIFEEDTVLWPSTDGLDLEFDDGVFMLLRYNSVIGSISE